MYPPFNLAKAYSGNQYNTILILKDIAALSGNTVNYAEALVTRGPGFTWRDLYQVRVRPKALGLPGSQISSIVDIYSFIYTTSNQLVLFFDPQHCLLLDPDLVF